jgi:hypothetical protein
MDELLVLKERTQAPRVSKDEPPTTSWLETQVLLTMTLQI